MHLETFLTSALLILVATSIAVALFKHIGFGSILGLLVAGVVVGPYSPGPRVTEHVADVRHFTELGVVLLLFLIGLEMKPSRLWAMRREVLGLGSLQILLSGAAIGLYFSLYQDAWLPALFIGMAFALSSTAFVLQLLHEQGEIASRHGSTAFSILLMQDLAVVPLLAAVPIVSATGTLSAEIPLWEQIVIVVAVLGLIVAVGRYALPAALDYLAERGNREGFLLTVMLAVFFAAWSMHRAGLSMALGAFVMGMLLSDSRYRLQIQATVEPYKGILMSLFFVAVGMSIDIGALAENPLHFAQHTSVIVTLKLLVLFLLAVAFGFPRAVAVRVSFLLAQGGEFGFVLFGAAKALDVIDDTTFVHAIGVISITMLATPLLVRIGDLLARRLEPRRPDGAPFPPEPGEDEAGRRVIIGGYGRVGHAVATLLHNSGVPILAFDTDPARVERGRRDGLPVYFGDIGDADLLASARVDRAALVVITIDRSATAERAVAHIRNSSAKVPVIARARDLDTCGRLTAAGASHAFPETLETSLYLGGLALEMVNVPDASIEDLVQRVRSDNYRLIAPQNRGG